MAAGGVLSYLLLIPLIKFFGEGLAGPLAPGSVLIKDMSPNQIRGAYILYIGAGAVAAGGIISLVRSLPLIWHGIREGLRDFGGEAGEQRIVPRTDHDLSMKVRLRGNRRAHRSHSVRAEPAHEPHGRRHDYPLRLPLRHRLVAAYG
jgi:uncharacterized oligopeptide transporter (OPT) family protein